MPPWHPSQLLERLSPSTPAHLLLPPQLQVLLAQPLPPREYQIQKKPLPKRSKTILTDRYSGVVTAPTATGSPITYATGAASINGISAFGLFVAGGVALVSPSCSSPYRRLTLSTALVSISISTTSLNGITNYSPNGAMIALTWLMTLRFFDGSEIPGWHLQSNVLYRCTVRRKVL